jgi:hypothetical protein
VFSALKILSVPAFGGPVKDETIVVKDIAVKYGINLGFPKDPEAHF